MADDEAFLDSYSPRYGRRYRDIDFEAELGPSRGPRLRGSGVSHGDHGGLRSNRV